MIQIKKIRKPLLALSAIIAIAGITFGIVATIKKSHKLTDFEYAAFTERSTEIMSFFEIIEADRFEPADNQIVYALERLYADTGKQEFAISDVQNILNSTFTDAADVENRISESEDLALPEYQVFYNKKSKKLSIEKDLFTHEQAIHTPITKYILTSVSKKSTTYTAIYDKYVFDEPYQILNRTSLDDTVGEHSVKDYLAGNGTSLALKELLNETNVKDIREPSAQITVTYTLENSQLLLEKYE